MTPPTSAPLHIVSSDGAPPTIPSTRVPLPSPAPAGDRDAADLRGHLQSAGWAADAATCYRMLKWQRANNLDDITAARTISLPHIGHEVFARLRENRKPIGVGSHWPALQELVVQAAAQARFDAMVAVCPAVPPAPAEVLPTPAPAVPTPKAGPDIAALARRVESESTRDSDRRTTRTRETAQLIYETLTKLQISNWKLARMLASVGSNTSPTVATVGRWDQRLRLYERIATPAAAPVKNTAPVKTANVTSSMMQIIVDELGPKGRTLATAAMIRTAAKKLATRAQLERSYKSTFAGARSLANQLAQIDANARGQTPDEKLRETWAWRIDAYLPLVLALDTPSPVASTSAPSSSPAPSSSRGSVVVDEERIIGRPVLLADGCLRVTVARTVRVETKISFSDPLWAAAMAAVNASA
jgi:hypothetical protein